MEGRPTSRGRESSGLRPGGAGVTSPPVTDVCQYCGADLEASPPRSETGFLYGIECRRCPAERRRVLMLARPQLVAELRCPDCGAAMAPADRHPDVLVIKEMTYDLCPACGERCGVSAVRKLRDVSGGTM